MILLCVVFAKISLRVDWSKSQIIYIVYYFLGYTSLFCSVFLVECFSCSTYNNKHNNNNSQQKTLHCIHEPLHCAINNFQIDMIYFTKHSFFGYSSNIFMCIVRLWEKKMVKNIFLYF